MSVGCTESDVEHFEVYELAVWIKLLHMTNCSTGLSLHPTAVGNPYSKCTGYSRATNLPIINYAPLYIYAYVYIYIATY